MAESPGKYDKKIREEGGPSGGEEGFNMIKEEELIKKSRKPRPRDVIDVEDLRNRHLKKYFGQIKEQHMKQ